VDDKTVGLIAFGIGALFVYAGIRGFSILKAVQNVIKGDPPQTGQQTKALADVASDSGTSGGGSLVSGGPAKQVLQKTASQFGWGSGAQWQALDALEMGEAGYDPDNKNPGSGAYGLAQALNHGTSRTQGTRSNMYGNFGLSDEQNRKANSGDASAQSLWMCHYIKATYGDPIKAKAAWDSRSPHWY
jgi:hypothetical protein